MNIGRRGRRNVCGNAGRQLSLELLVDKKLNRDPLKKSCLVG